MYTLEKNYYHVMSGVIPEDAPTFAHGVIEQLQGGQIFVDNTANPEAYLIRNSSGTYYIGGNLEKKQFVYELIDYLKNKGNHKIFYDLGASSKAWLDVMEHELAGNVVRLSRVNFVYREFHDQLTALPKGFRIVQLDKHLYEKYVEEVDRSYAMIFSSADDFLQNSFGFCILDGEEFVSTCNAYHISKKYAEVDILTISKYRNHGYAAIVVKAFVEECIKRNLILIWDADKGNTASLHLAGKCGFEKRFDEEELWWHEDKKQIEAYLKRYGYTN